MRYPGRSPPRRTWPGRCWTPWARPGGPAPWCPARRPPISAPAPGPAPGRASSRSAWPPAGLGPTARAALGQLVALYLGRLPAGLAARQAATVAAGELHFAWEGPTTPGLRHYYRVQGDDLLIEYDSTADDGNHAHTVLRRPRSDFGDDVLAAHYRQAHA